MRLPRFKTKKIKTFFKKIPRLCGEKAFLSFLTLFFFAMILGGFVFYNYGILAKKITPETDGMTIQFQEKTYETILHVWQEKEEKLKETDAKIYLNPFK